MPSLSVSTNRRLSTGPGLSHCYAGDGAYTFLHTTCLGPDRPPLAGGPTQATIVSSGVHERALKESPGDGNSSLGRRTVLQTTLVQPTQDEGASAGDARAVTIS